MNNNLERKFTEKVLAKFLETALEIGNRDVKKTQEVALTIACLWF
jgi:hypothetical protein